MKIFALIPDEYLKEAEVSGFTFQTNCTLGKNESGEMTLIVKVVGEFGKVKNGSQYIADLNLIAEGKEGSTNF